MVPPATTPVWPGDGDGGVDFAALFRGIPTPYLVMTPDPDFTIVDANDAYLANVGRTRAELVGRAVFEAFPPAPDTLDEDGVPRIRVSFERARDTGVADTMPIQKYDIPDPVTGGVVVKFWSLISVPILGEGGQVAWVVQRAEDITDFVTERDRQQLEQDSGLVWRRRAEEVELDLFARARELEAAVAAKEVASARLASLAEVVLALTTAETVEELAQIVFDAGLRVIGAVGGSIAVRTPGSDILHVTVTASLGADSQRTYAQLPLDGPLPTSRAARGQLVLVPDERAAADYPGLVEALALTGTQAWAALPLLSGERLLGSLSVGYATSQLFPHDEVELLQAFAAQCAQVMDRLAIRQAERSAAAEVARISETLQRSLLSAPPAGGDLRFAVAYQPASQVAQVGGDWYDAFTLPDDSTTVVIGDVAGHDQDAAAAMAQVRNILRGIAQTVGEPPAVVLAALDLALHQLQLGVLATLVLAQISRPAGRDGSRTMRWCNAGHPPPILIRADGTVEVLARTPEILTGIEAHPTRSDHQVTLHPGDTVLLYTDGLVETRRGDIDTDIDRLRVTVAGHRPDTGPDALLTLISASLQDLNDDVALLAVQVPRSRLTTPPQPGGR